MRPRPGSVNSVRAGVVALLLKASRRRPCWCGDGGGAEPGVGCVALCPEESRPLRGMRRGRRGRRGRAPGPPGKDVGPFGLFGRRPAPGSSRPSSGRSRGGGPSMARRIVNVAPMAGAHVPYKATGTRSMGVGFCVSVKERSGPTCSDRPVALGPRSSVTTTCGRTRPLSTMTSKPVTVCSRWSLPRSTLTGWPTCRIAWRNWVSVLTDSMVPDGTSCGIGRGCSDAVRSRGDEKNASISRRRRTLAARSSASSPFQLRRAPLIPSENNSASSPKNAMLRAVNMRSVCVSGGMSDGSMSWFSSGRRVATSWNALAIICDSDCDWPGRPLAIGEVPATNSSMTWPTNGAADRTFTPAIGKRFSADHSARSSRRRLRRALRPETLSVSSMRKKIGVQSICSGDATTGV